MSKRDSLIYQTRPTNRQRRALERREKLIPMCRYYKGEEDCPSELKENKSLLWSYERTWVEDMSQSYTNGDDWRKTYEEYHLETFAKKHNIPATLTGLLFNRYMHWGSGHETTEGFIQWMEDNYLQ